MFRIQSYLPPFLNLDLHFKRCTNANTLGDKYLQPMGYIDIRACSQVACVRGWWWCVDCVQMDVSCLNECVSCFNGCVGVSRGGVIAGY